MTLIVSLTTIPSRFDKLEPVIAGLLAQTADIEEIRLYVPKKYRRFPDYSGTVPSVAKGVRIMRPNDDLGPASKVLFTVDDLRGSDCDIIYCDDDRIYPTDWFRQMLSQRGERKGHCLATAILGTRSIGPQTNGKRMPRARLVNTFPKTHLQLVKRKLKQLLTGDEVPKPYRRLSAGYTDIAAGFGAVLVRPDFFDSSAFDIPAVLWSVDDVWLSGQMAKNDVPIWCGENFGEPPQSDAAEVDALYAAVIDGAARHEANEACVRYMQDTYGIWK